MTKEDTSEEHIDMDDDVSEEESKPSTSTRETSSESHDSHDSKPKRSAPHHRVWDWALRHKAISIPVAVVVVLGVLAAVPFTRYLLAGMVVRSNFAVVITDSQTNKPVTSASVTLEGKTVKTDNQGKVTIHANVGSAKLTASKQYYHDASAGVVVPFSQKKPYALTMTATGRQVPVTVLNTISGQPAANVTISAQNTQAITDKKGEATLVLPADKTTVTGTVSANGFNKAAVTVKITASTDPANTFKITPAGKLYFLSDASGQLDVAKSDLDGQNRQVVLPGTGKEEKPSTVLLASRDWKYIALLSKRDGGDNAKLFLIESDSDKVTTMDEGDASFTPIGWSGDRFIYIVNRTKVAQWQPNAQALKSYSASAKSITVLDQTAGQGTDSNNYLKESVDTALIFDKEIVYSKSWNSNGVALHAADKPATFNSIQADGSQKKVVKSYPSPTAAAPSFFFGYNTIQLTAGDFNEAYIQYTANGDGKQQYDSYENGKLSPTTLTDIDFYSRTYLRYIVSPTGNKTFWTDFRDGKNIFFVGDAKGENGKQIGTASEDYVAYGWYSDDYLLLTKKSSEMRILPVGGLPDGIEAALKVSDYYKPNYNLRGYGYGYGG